MIATTLLSGASLAQDGSGTVTFTVEVTGTHNVPTLEGGYRSIAKKRTFSGSARLKHGQSFAPPAMKGYDKASFEREKDACEQKNSDEEAIAACQDEVQARQNAAERGAMQSANPVISTLRSPRTDVWTPENCSGRLEISDKGSYRLLSEGGWAQGPYSLSATREIAKDASGSDGCSFGLVYDPSTQTVEINFDPGPLRVEAVERVGNSSSKTHLNPFDWSAVRKFEKGNIKVAGTQAGHSGTWHETKGEPMALVGASRVKGEVVQTETRVTWHFTGKPSPPEARSPARDDAQRDNAPVGSGPARNIDPIPGCLKEQERAGRAQPDPMELMRCLERSAGQGS